MRGKSVAGLVPTFMLALAPLVQAGISGEQLTKLIDQRKYAEVVALFPSEPRGNETHLVFKGYAQLGLGNFEPLNLFARIKEPQAVTHPVLREYYAGCPNIQLDKRMRDIDKCLIIRLFNQIPHHDDAHLQAALQTFRLLHATGHLTSRQDRVLHALLELSFVFSKLRHSLYLYEALDADTISYDETKVIYLVIRSAGENMEKFTGHYRECEVLLNHKLLGSKTASLFQKLGDGKVVFMEKTGLPMFFKVTDLENESTTALVGRNVIVQLLDQATNFFRAPLEIRHTSR